MNISIPNCPICGGRAVSSQITVHKVSKCKQGHIWHYCPVHNTPIIGPVINKLVTDCICKQSSKIKQTPTIIPIPVVQNTEEQSSEDIETIGEILGDVLESVIDTIAVADIVESIADAISDIFD